MFVFSGFKSDSEILLASANVSAFNRDWEEKCEVICRDRYESCEFRDNQSIRGGFKFTIDKNERIENLLCAQYISFDLRHFASCLRPILMESFCTTAHQLCSKPAII